MHASSESRSANNSIEPFRSAKSAVTCLRSPSIELLEVKIFSAKWLGCVGLRRCEARDRRRSWHQFRRVGTLGTELCRRRQLSTAFGAHSGQRRPAFLAELRPRLVLALALRTLHDQPLKRADSSK